MLFRGKKSGKIHTSTMDLLPSYKYIEIFRGGAQWFMMKSKDFVLSTSFNFKNENVNLLSFKVSLSDSLSKKFDSI